MRATLAAALLLVAVPATSHAASPATLDRPLVRESLSGTALVDVLGTDGIAYTVHVGTSLATGFSTEAPWSGALVRFFTCGTPQPCTRNYTSFQNVLVPGQFDASDETRFSITLRGFGKPFAVTWKGPGRGGSTPYAAPSGTYNAVGYAWPATASVTMLGRTCAARYASAARLTSLWATGRPPYTYPPMPSRPVPGVPPAIATCL